MTPYLLIWYSLIPHSIPKSWRVKEGTINISVWYPRIKVTRWSLYPSLSCCHGVVLWMEYRLLMNKPHLLSTGLLEHPSPQGRLSWSTYHNQGVAFFIDYTRTEVKYSVKFHISTGEMVMEFV